MTADRKIQEAFTVKEVAAAFNISTRTVWRLIKAGKISTFKLGRSIRIARSEFDRIQKQGIE